MFLPLNVAKSIDKKREQGLSNAKIIEAALKKLNFEQQETDALINWLYTDMNKNFDILMNCLLNGYEIDETKEYEKIGILTHPYLVREMTKHQPTFTIFHFQKDNFIGSIWMPYYSKPDYIANMSFRFEIEKTTLGTSRLSELESTPQWFQELYTSCKLYIQNRNKSILGEVEKEFEKLYTKVKQDKTFSFDQWTKSDSMKIIMKYQYKVVPAILKKLVKTEEELLCHIVDEIAQFEWNFKIHDDTEKLKEYKKAKTDITTWKEYLLNWGKQRHWI